MISFFGIGVKKGEEYVFSVWARADAPVRMRVEIVNTASMTENHYLCQQRFTVNSKEWTKYKVTLRPDQTLDKANLRIFMELHIEKALEVTNTAPTDPHRPVYGLELDGVVTQMLADCDYFIVNRHRIIKEAAFSADKSSFAHVLMIGGSGGELVTDTCTLELKMGTSVFVPAGTGAYTIKGNCDVIITTLP